MTYLVMEICSVGLTKAGEFDEKVEAEMEAVNLSYDDSVYGVYERNGEQAELVSVIFGQKVFSA